jgi:hypothetical protein
MSGSMGPIGTPGDPDQAGPMSDRSPLPPMPPPPRTVRRWTAGRIVAVVLGGLLGLFGIGLSFAGAAALWATQTQRDSAGYLVTPYSTLSSGTYALTSDSIEIHGVNGETWTFPEAVLGSTKIEISPNGSQPLFVGIGPTPLVNRYLSGVAHAVVADVPGGALRTIQGAQPQGPPGRQPFWTAQRSGNGSLSLSWTPSAGSWTVVVMNADASRGVNVSVRVGAKVPALASIAGALLAVGVIFAIAGLLLVVIPVVRVGRDSRAARPARLVRS